MSSQIKKDGERFKWIGDRFLDSCEKLIKNLGYKISSISKDHKDFIIEGSLKKIPFGPSKRCVVEVTTCNIRDKEIKEILGKMEDENVEDGLWISNSKINEETIRKARKNKIFIWDVRVLCFISAIQNIQGFWCTGKIVEKEINKGIHIIRSLERPKKGDIFVNALIFFTDLLEDLMIEDLKKALKTLFQDLVDSGLGPIDVNPIVLSLGLVNKAAYSGIGKLIEELNEEFTKEGIYINQEEMPVEIIDFYTSPADYNLLFS